MTIKGLRPSVTGKSALEVLVILSFPAESCTSHVQPDPDGGWLVRLYVCGFDVSQPYECRDPILCAPLSILYHRHSPKLPFESAANWACVVWALMRVE